MNYTTLPPSPPGKRLRKLSNAVAIALAVSFATVLCTPGPTNAQTAPAPSTAQESDKGKIAAEPAPASEAPPAEQPVRSVSLVTPRVEMWPDQIEAQGNIMPWQETRVGTEIGGLRLVSVQANVGDVVKKGQVLARLNPATVEVELEAANAQLIETQAALAQAEATLDRAKRLAPSGGISQQELTLYETQKQTAAARLSATRAQVKTQQLRLESATLVAPDDGVISSRTAAEGAIVQAGSELFRLIRQGRLEWRAEVGGETLLKLSAGQEVTVKSPLGQEIKGRVRQVSPTIDLTTRNGLVYVDLPSDTNFKAGLHVSGTLAIKRKALVVPSSAVAHDGEKSRVFTVNAADGKVEAVDVKIGRTRNKQEEIVSGLDEQTPVIARDVDSLKAGDFVKVQEAQEKQKVSNEASSSTRS